MNKMVLLGVTLLPVVRTPAVAQGQAAPTRTIQYEQRSRATTLSDSVLSIGDGRCLLNRVRDVLQYSDGRILIFNEGDQNFCLFDARGAFLRTWGAQGSGPGEFRQVYGLGLSTRDSLYVIDRSLSRATAYSPAGDLAWTSPFEKNESGLGSMTSVTVLGGGDLLVGFSEFRSGPPADTAVYFRQRLVRGKQGQTAKSIGSFPNAEHFIQSTTPERGGVAYYKRVFGRQFAIASIGSGFLGGDGTAFEITEYSDAGVPLVVHRVSRPVPPVTDTDIAAYKERTLGAVSASARAMEERRLAAMPYPRQYPAYRRVLAERTGRIWLEVYPKTGESQKEWIRLDPRSRIAESFVLPSHFQLQTVAMGRACGVMIGEDGAEGIRCYRVP